MLFAYYKLKSVSFERKLYDQIFALMIKIGSIYAIIGLLYALMKYHINLPRPYCSMLKVISVADFTHVRCLSSFPSAHTALAVLACYCAFPYLKLKGRVCAICLVVLVGLSRISLAMHFPADVIYSILISLIICISVDKIQQLKFIQHFILSPIANWVYKLLCHYG